MRRLVFCLMGLGIVMGATQAARVLWSQQIDGRPQTPSRPQPGLDEPRAGQPDPRFGPPPEPIFQALDSNRDGQISPQEIKAATAALKKLDRNGDGELSGEEMRPPGGPRMFFNRGGGPGGPMRQDQKLVEQFDKNKNQRLDRDERRAARELLRSQPQQSGRGGRLRIEGSARLLPARPRQGPLDQYADCQKCHSSLL